MAVKRVAIWAAVSSLPQAKKISLEDQLATGRAHAAGHGAQVVAELVVPGESRNIVLWEDACQRIEAYARLRTLIDGKSIDALIYLDPSRLGRTAALVLTVAELCTRARILLYETDNPTASMEFTPPDYDDLLVRAIKATGAQHEVHKIQERHRKGMADRVTKGRMPGKVNWGYIPQYESGKLAGYAIDDDAATTIRLIVELYLDRGFGALNIADHINRLGKVAPAGGQWGHSQITFLLRRVWRYAGYAELNVHSATGRPYVRARGNWPAIVTEEQARLVMEERKERNRNRRSVHTVYRFTRMVHCAVCDSRLHASTKYRDWTKADGSPGHYEHISYRCPAEHIMIGEKKIMRALEAYVKQLDDEAFRAGILASPDADPSGAIAAQIEALREQLDSLKRGIAKADNDHYVAGALDAERHAAIVNTAKARMTTIAADMTALQDRLLSALSDAQRSSRVDDMRLNGLKWLHHEDTRTANAWLRQRFRVYVEKRQVVGIEIL